MNVPYPVFEILICKVIFTNGFPIKNKSIPIVNGSNESPFQYIGPSVKQLNGQLAFRMEFRAICYLEDLFPL